MIFLQATFYRIIKKCTVTQNNLIFSCDFLLACSSVLQESLYVIQHMIVQENNTVQEVQD